MINPIDRNSTGNVQTLTQSATKPDPQPKNNPPQDSVQLSQAALTATGDKDHDGDSH